MFNIQVHFYAILCIMIWEVEAKYLLIFDTVWVILTKVYICVHGKLHILNIFDLRRITSHIDYSCFTDQYSDGNESTLLALIVTF